MFLAFQYPQEIAGRLGDPVPPPGAVGPQGHRPVRARAAPRHDGLDEAPRHGLARSSTATSTRASAAARRSATRSCRWRSSNPSSRSSTRPTPASTSTRCASSPRASARSAPTGRTMGVVLITHYQRLLDELQPDHVHILIGGRIVESGGMELAETPRARRLRELPLRRRDDDRRRSTSPRSRATSRSSRQIDGQPIVYLDSANTSQKPRQVIDAMSRFMETAYAPINRSGLPARRRGDRRLRGRAAQGAAVHQRAARPRS